MLGLSCPPHPFPLTVAISILINIMFELLDFERRTLPIPPAIPASRPSLLPFLADHHLPYIIPALVYWIIGAYVSSIRATFCYQTHRLLGLSFHYVETKGLLSVYKLHTPAEFLKKNRATRREVVKFALIQQAGQIILGYLMADNTEVFYSDSYSIAVWAQRIRQIQFSMLHLIHYFGFTSGWAAQTSAGSEALFVNQALQKSAGVCLQNSSQAAYAGCTAAAASFTRWEWATAEILYWVVVPTLQYVAAMALADSFQYFTHRAFHVNKWLYSKLRSIKRDLCA